VVGRELIKKQLKEEEDVMKNVADIYTVRINMEIENINN